MEIKLVHPVSKESVTVTHQLQYDAFTKEGFVHADDKKALKEAEKESSAKRSDTDSVQAETEQESNVRTDANYHSDKPTAETDKKGKK